MPVTANSTRLRSRLNGLRRTLPVAASAAIVEAAQESVQVIGNAVRAQWADHNQVGFDLENFVNLIQRLEVLQGGGIGALNTERMGTAATFEAIRGIPGLWHQGTGSGRRFGLFVNQVGWLYDQVAELAQGRKRMWGGAEPQWYLIEYGTTGTPGAYDPRPPTMTITTAIMDLTPRVYSVVENTVTRILRQRGLLS